MKKSKTNAMMLIGDEDGAKKIMMTRRDMDCKCYEVDWRWGCMNWKNSNGCISIYSLGPDDYELDQPTKSDHNHQDGRPVLGTGCPTKTDEFLETFQTAFDPPSFSENHIAVFSGIHDRRTVYNGKNLQYKFLDWKWPPPLLELFRKNIRFGRERLPLNRV